MTALVAGVLAWLAWMGGAHDPSSRAMVGLAIYWLAVLALGTGMWPKSHLPTAALLVGAALGALATVTLLSATWAPSHADAVVEFHRAAIYVGVFVVVCIASRPATGTSWANGIALGVVSIAAMGLGSRLWPEAFPKSDAGVFLPAAIERLSFPLGYWNGLAITSALGLPLLLRIAIAGRRLAARAGAVAAIPVIASVILLASSRGGVAVAVAGVGAYLLLSSRRWVAATAIAVGAVGAAAAVAVLLARDELVNGPLGSSLAASQGREAAGLLALVCLGTFLLFGAIAAVSPTRSALPGWVGRSAVVVMTAAVIVAVGLADPIQRFEEFRQPPEAASITRTNFVQSHLASGNGSGRWQFWEAAWASFESHPFLGRGAGSYEAWWSQRGTLAMFVVDAHSLYFEALGELGAVGGLLVVGVFASAIAIGTRRVFRQPRARRELSASVTAGTVAFAVAVGTDWMWELTLTGAIGIALLGLGTGPATQANDDPSDPARLSSRPARITLGVAALIAGMAVCALSALLFLSARELEGSQAAVEGDDLELAARRARAAIELTPWADEPHTQLALVLERAGSLPAASAEIGRAIERDVEDWRLWLIAARIHTKMEAFQRARRDLARAAALNPRSPLFTQLDQPSAG